MAASRKMSPDPFGLPQQVYQQQRNSRAAFDPVVVDLVEDEANLAGDPSINDSLTAAPVGSYNPDAPTQGRTRAATSDESRCASGPPAPVHFAGQECESAMARAAEAAKRAAAVNAVRAYSPEHTPEWERLVRAFDVVKLRAVDPLDETFYPNGSEDVFLGTAQVFFEIQRRLIDRSQGMVSKTLPARVRVQFDQNDHPQVKTFEINLDAF